MRERDSHDRPICTVCGTPIRFIEQVSDPRGRAVHFYCLAAARGGGAPGGPALRRCPRSASQG